MSISELLSYLLLIIIGYCMGKILLSRYESYEPSPSPEIVSSEEGLCLCLNDGNRPYEQKAYIDGGNHLNPFTDYCDRYSGVKAGCEGVFYYDMPVGPYKICRFDDTTKKCTSDGAIDCDYIDVSENPKCNNPQDLQKMCCSTQKYN
jgi:hypothetical protein